MRILSHRGCWNTVTEQNTLQAFIQSFRQGFGVEVDVRDRLGQAVISHEPPVGRKPTLEALLRAYVNWKKPGTLALNIKADGLDDWLDRLLKKYGVSDYFLFDMSCPGQFRMHSRHPGLVVAARHSDIERSPLCYDAVSWVWMDELAKSWINSKVIERHVKNGKKVCIVSPELHGRAPGRAWRLYRGLRDAVSRNVYLCTDRPRAAADFFNAAADD